MTPRKKIKARSVSTRFEFDPALAELLSTAALDRNKAWEALAIAASYMEKDQKLPFQLATHLARAIRGALAVRSHKDLALRKGLGLAAGNRRRAGANELEIGRAMELNIEDGVSENAAAKDVGRRYGVSVATAKRRLREYRNVAQSLQRDE